MRSPGPVGIFRDHLQQIRRKSEFTFSPKKLCIPFYSDKSHPSSPPGRYFRSHLEGYFEGIDSEHRIEWHSADSLSLRDFFQHSTKESVPDHSSLSCPHSRLPRTIHQEVFTWVLKVISKDGLVLGGCIGADASTTEANAALKTIVRRDMGESYRMILLRMARESSIEAQRMKTSPAMKYCFIILPQIGRQPSFSPTAGLFGPEGPEGSGCEWRKVRVCGEGPALWNGGGALRARIGQERSEETFALG